MKSYNSVSVGRSKTALKDEEKLFISFYNEDSNGEETDTIGVELSLETANSLSKMLDHYLSQFVY